MNFCSNCGKELQQDWNICPFCSTPLPTSTGDISDSVIMGDLNVQTTIQTKGDVRNHMLTLIDALKEGREERAIEIFELAKKIDYDLATELYDHEYNSQICELRFNLLAKEWDSILEDTKFFIDTPQEKLAKLKLKKERSGVVIEKCEQMIKTNPSFAPAIELLYIIWKNSPGYFVADRFSFGSHSTPGAAHDWFVKKFRDAGMNQRADQILFALEQKLERELAYQKLVFKYAGIVLIVIIILSFFGKLYYEFG